MDAERATHSVEASQGTQAALNLVLNRKRWEVPPMETGLPV